MTEQKIFLDNCGWFVQLNSGHWAGVKSETVFVSLESFPPEEGPWDRMDKFSDTQARRATPLEEEEFWKASPFESDILNQAANFDQECQWSI